MITKEELTGLLRDASDLEEGIMGFLTKYAGEIFDCPELSPDKIAEAKGLIQRMKEDSERHKGLVENIISWISGRGENEF